MNPSFDSAKEAAHFDEVWCNVKPRKITEALEIPGVPSLKGKRVLVCSCGSGLDPVRAANAGAQVFAVDLSPVGVRKAKEMAEFNGREIMTQVMDLHRLEFPADFFDAIYGTAILHHLDCNQAGSEFHRVLKSGGVGYFEDENTDQNPVLAFFYRRMSGTDQEGNFKKYLFLKRQGTTNERMFTSEDLRRLSSYFPSARAQTDSFMFFQKLSHVSKMRGIKLTSALDRFCEWAIPPIRRFSYEQNIWFRKNTQTPYSRAEPRNIELD